MVDRVQVTRYYSAWQRPPNTDVSGEVYVNFADIQIGALDLTHSPVDFVAVRYYSQTSRYVEGDYSVYNGLLYRCIENTPNPAGPFDSARWSEVLDLQEVTVLIAQETSRAEAVEAHLQSEINAEITRAEAAEANLQSEINGINSSLSGLIPTGISLDYYGVTPPAGWLLEDGSIYNISAYPALGAFLGNRFGGNGTTTFAVPNSLGRFGVATSSSFPLGSMGGLASATLSSANLPSHTHTIQPHIHTTQPHVHSFSSTTIGMSTTVSATGFAAGASAPPAVNLSGDIQPATVTVNASAVLTTDATGTGAPLATLPPYISRTRIIKT
jgi:microcystin-dependent protein